MRRSILTILAAAALATPALAQSDPTQPAPATPNAGTQTLDRAIANSTTDTQVHNAVNQGQYEADKLAYRNAVIAHNIAVAHDQVRYAHQQNAYADAMAAWRLQADACKRGDRKQCERPEPDPAAFY